MTKLTEIWRRITATRYTRALEAEVTRLRAENRALLNSILGIAGVPPITVAAPPDPTPDVDVIPTPRAGEAGAARDLFSASTDAPRVPHASTSRVGNVASHAVRRPPRMRLKPPTDAVVPLRRRSWHQIYRMLEFDSARRESSKGSLQSTVNS